MKTMHSIMHYSIHYPQLLKLDYTKCLSEVQNINYAISIGHTENGIEHLRFQLESESELQKAYANMNEAKGTMTEKGECTCCYSK
jgi:hypothetical protein